MARRRWDVASAYHDHPRSGDAIGMREGDIVFDFATSGGIDGLDFRVEGTSGLALVRARKGEWRVAIAAAR